MPVPDTCNFNDKMHHNHANGISSTHKPNTMSVLNNTNGGIELPKYVEVRKSMKKYWEVFGPTMESMMLSHDAGLISDSEQSELLSYLPDYEAKDVLELGAGIGRYSSKLAEAAGHLTAVDFMESYTAQNQKQNGHLNNITFKCADVTKLDFPPQSFDLIFSNWLLMYLDDTEIESLFAKILSWLKPSGHFFLRESCYHPSGNFKRSENPTNYRKPLEYIDLLSASKQNENFFSILFCKSVFTYVFYNGNPNQLCFLAQKRTAIETLTESRQKLSDPDAFTLRSLSELSSGKEFIMNSCSKLELSSRQRVLNLFGGTGELSFLLAEHFNVFVHGLEEENNLMQLSVINQGKQEEVIRKMIQFESTVISENSFPPESYDAVLSFGSINMRPEDIFLSCKDSIKRGGKLLLCDFFPTKTETNGRHNNNGCKAEDVKCLMESCGFCVEIESNDEIVMTMMKELKEKVMRAEDYYGTTLLEKIREKEDAISKGILRSFNIRSVKL